MENNLVQQVKSYFSEEAISSLSTHVGEDHDHVKKGVEVSIPSLLLGFQSHHGDGLDSLLHQARHLFSSFEVGHIFGSFFGSDYGTDDTKFESQNLLSSIFGDKLQSTVTTLANLVGIKEEAMRNILGATLPAVISTITHKGSIWNAAEIRHILDAHKHEIASALPVIIGLGTFGSSFAQAERPVEIGLPEIETGQQADLPPPIVHTEERVKASRRSTGILWIFVPLLVLFLWFFFGRGCRADNPTIFPDTTPAVVP